VIKRVEFVVELLEVGCTKSQLPPDCVVADAVKDSGVLELNVTSCDGAVPPVVKLSGTDVVLSVNAPVPPPVVLTLSVTLMFWVVPPAFTWTVPKYVPGERPTAWVVMNNVEFVVGPPEFGVTKSQFPPDVVKALAVKFNAFTELNVTGCEGLEPPIT
jgi:hypothetical protein